jgi:hypothetical protein
MVESSVGQRFSQLIQQLGMSKNAFAMSLDKTATVVQHLVDERNKPGFDLMCKVFEVYPNVSKDWLLLGKGPMLLNGLGDPSVVEAPEVPVPATAAPTAPAKQPTAPATSAVPSFPAPLFAVSTARPPVLEVPAPPVEPVTPAPQEVMTAASQAAVVTALGAAPPTVEPVTPSPAPSPAAPTAPSASLDATALTAALHAQYLQHQLALAEQRNQHLLEQQKLMQQLVDVLQKR